MRALFEKLKRLKCTLKPWNQDTFGNIFDNTRVTENKADDEELYFQLDSSEGTSNPFIMHKNSAEKVFYHQKSRIKWLKEGELNFFHASLGDKMHALQFSKSNQLLIHG
ncbi:hypothetical protein ACH5RR_029295 [Cinchona calisaya]|uniref:Uncharacterized protein n=1 Tax=Cinchona calisaya TaxID=153742 RepID=A0ABD2YR85_9GENT